MSRSWHDLTPDPNSREALDYRRRQLEAAQRPPITDKLARIVQLATGKRVLDVGCVDHFLPNDDSPTWQHGRVRAVAESVLGLDILAADVAKLSDRGFNVLVCDITRERPPGSYELVVCGDVIEHVGDPGRLIANTAACLEPGGRLVLATPNPYYLHRAYRSLRGRATDSVDHVTLLYPAGMAELADRSGLVLDKYYGVLVASARTTMGKVTLKARPLLGRLFGFSPDAFCETLVYEFVRRD